MSAAKTFFLTLAILLVAYSIWVAGRRVQHQLREIRHICECAPCPGEDVN